MASRLVRVRLEPVGAARDKGVLAGMSERTTTRDAPERARVVLISLILVAAVANLNLSVANVALPDIGASFDSSQTSLNLIAVGYSLGLAASVLWFGALGDRYGRKLMIILGMVLSIPASPASPASRRRTTVLFAARVLGGLSPAWRIRRRSR